MTTSSSIKVKPVASWRQEMLPIDGLPRSFMHCFGRPMLEDSYRLTQSVQDLCRPSRKSTANVPKVFKFPRLSQWAEPRAAPPLRTSATLGRPGALAVLLVSAPTPYSEVRKDKTIRAFNPRVVLRRFTERRCVTVIRMTKRKIALRLKRTAPGSSGAAARNGKRTGIESMARAQSCPRRVEATRGPPVTHTRRVWRPMVLPKSNAD